MFWDNKENIDFGIEEGGRIGKFTHQVSINPDNRKLSIKQQKRRIFIEYYGEAIRNKPSPENCPGKNLVGLAQCFPDCVCDDSWNNTYTCAIDNFTSGKINKICQFEDEEKFLEIYNVFNDPFELDNLAETVNGGKSDESQNLKTIIQEFFSNFKNCEEDKCRDYCEHVYNSDILSNNL